jgi:hypothetical protein
MKNQTNFRICSYKAPSCLTNNLTILKNCERILTHAGLTQIHKPHPRPHPEMGRGEKFPLLRRGAGVRFCVSPDHISLLESHQFWQAKNCLANHFLSNGDRFLTAPSDPDRNSLAPATAARAPRDAFVSISIARLNARTSNTPRTPSRLCPGTRFSHFSGRGVGRGR